MVDQECPSECPQSEPVIGTGILAMGGRPDGDSHLNQYRATGAPPVGRRL